MRRCQPRQFVVRTAMGALYFGTSIAPDLNHASTGVSGSLDGSIAPYVPDAVHGSNPALAGLRTTDEAREFQLISVPKAGPRRLGSRARVPR